MKKAKRGRRKRISRVGRPVASPLSPRPPRTGRFQPPRPPLFGTLCGAAPCGAAFGVPLAPYGRARLVVAGGRMSSGFLVRRLAEPFGTALQSRRPPESDATERPPRDRLPSACMTRCARGSSPKGSGGRGSWLGIDVKDLFLDIAGAAHLSRTGEVELREAQPGEGSALRGGACSAFYPAAGPSTLPLSRP